MRDTREAIERRAEPNGIVRRERITRVLDDVDRLTAARAASGEVIVQIGGDESGFSSWFRRRAFSLSPSEARSFAALLLRLAAESDAQAAEPAA